MGKEKTAPDPDPPVEDAPAKTPTEEAEAELIAWGNENGHVGADIAALRNFAPHEMLAKYDEAVAVAAIAEPPAEAPADESEPPAE